MLRIVARPKEKMINVRLSAEAHEDFKIACELRGGSMSSILHQFIVRTTWEEKERHPQAFQTEKPINGMKLALHSKKKVPLMNRPKEVTRRKTG